MRVIVAVLAPVVARDLGVVHALVEQPDDRPALGHVVQLVERAQVAEEALGLVERLERQDRLEERLGVGVRQSSAIASVPLACVVRAIVVAC